MKPLQEAAKLEEAVAKLESARDANIANTFARYEPKIAKLIEAASPEAVAFFRQARGESGEAIDAEFDAELEVVES